MKRYKLHIRLKLIFTLSCLLICQATFAEILIEFPGNFSNNLKNEINRIVSELEPVFGGVDQVSYIKIRDEKVLPFYYTDERTMVLGTQAPSEANQVMTDTHYLSVFTHELTHLLFHRVLLERWPDYYIEFDQKRSAAQENLKNALAQVEEQDYSAEAMAGLRQAKIDFDSTTAEGTLLNAYEELLADVVPSVYFGREDVLADALSFGADSEIEYLEYRKVNSTSLDEAKWQSFMSRMDEELGRRGIIGEYESFAPSRRSVWSLHKRHAGTVSPGEFIDRFLSVLLEEIQDNVIGFEGVQLQDLPTLNSSISDKLQSSVEIGRNKKKQDCKSALLSQ